MTVFDLAALGRHADRMEAINLAWRLRAEVAREYVLEQISRELARLPHLLFDDPDMPTRTLLDGSTISLFRLGEFRFIKLEEVRGRTVLHVGNDGHLYEYRPKYVEPKDDTDVMLYPVVLRLWPVVLEEVPLYGLNIILMLLRQIWVL